MTTHTKRIIRAVIDYFSKANRVVQFEPSEIQILCKLFTDFLRLTMSAGSRTSMAPMPTH